MANYFPTLKETVLPEDISSEIEELKATEILEHGAGNNSKYYVLVKVESELKLIKYNIKDVPEETVENFSEKIEDLKKIVAE